MILDKDLTELSCISKTNIQNKIYTINNDKLSVLTL